MKLSKIQLAIVAIIVSQLIWGAAPPLFKWSMQSIQPFTLGFIRFLLASIVILPFVRNDLAVDKQTLRWIALTALISVPLHIGLFLFGLQFASSLNVPIIGAAGPIFTIIFSSIFLHEKLRRKIVLGTLVSLFGVLLIVVRPIVEHGFDQSVVGNIFFVLSTMTGIAHLFLIKKLTRSASPKTLTYWTFLFGSLFFLPMMLWEMRSPSYSLTFDTYSVIGIVYGGVLSSALAWFLHAYAVQHLRPNDIGVFSYMGPIITALVAIPLLGETITFSYLLGSVFVFAGIFIAEAKFHHHPFHKPFS